MRHILKRLPGSAVREGMKQSNSAVKFRLDGGLAGNRERDLSQFFGRRMVVRLLCDSLSGADECNCDE